MARNRILTAALVTVLALTGCATTETDVSDCDAGDRRKHETPDCGFIHKGTSYEWSWVKAGKTVAPAGWSASKEKKSVTSKKKVNR